MNKVLVVNSPLFKWSTPAYDEDSLPPIGLGYIATILKQNGVSTELVDAVADNIPLEDLLRLVKSKSPTVVATNIFTTNYDLVKEFVESLNDISVRVIIGGLATKALYEDICTWNTKNEIDIVFGDGELITPALVTNTVMETPFIKRENVRVFIVDRGSIYYANDISDTPLDRSFFRNEPVSNPFGFAEANIVTSRGCVYNCAFCAAARSVNQGFDARYRSTESIIRELEHLAIDYPKVESVRILDDLFLQNENTIQRAVDIFSRFSFKWRSMAHVMTFAGISEEVLRLLKQSGCWELFVGIESGSPRVLKRIHKTHQIDLVKKTITTLMKVGIGIKAYFIYGFPDETEEDFRMTFMLARSLKQNSLTLGARFRTSVFQFRPYHGTELYRQIALKEGQATLTQRVEPNEELSDLLGRRQFNFHSGNYSAVDLETVHKYIRLTMDLNSNLLWELEV